MLKWLYGVTNRPTFSIRNQHKRSTESDNINIGISENTHVWRGEEKYDPTNAELPGRRGNGSGWRRMIMTSLSCIKCAFCLIKSESAQFSSSDNCRVR